MPQNNLDKSAVGRFGSWLRGGGSSFQWGAIKSLQYPAIGAYEVSRAAVQGVTAATLPSLQGTSVIVSAAVSGSRDVFSLIREGGVGFQEFSRDMPYKIPLLGYRGSEGVAERAFFSNVATGRVDGREFSKVAFGSGRAIKQTMPAFFTRTPWEHMKMGGVRTAQALHPKWLAIDALISGGLALSDTRSEDFLHPSKGIERNLAKYASATPGFLAGSAVGAAIGTAILPGIGTAIGYMAGGLGGTTMAEGLVDAPWKLAELGKKYRKQKAFSGQFLDSEASATTRRRSLRMIYESNLNARSALGNEAMSYHQ